MLGERGAHDHAGEGVQGGDAAEDGRGQRAVEVVVQQRLQHLEGRACRAVEQSEGVSTRGAKIRRSWGMGMLRRCGDGTTAVPAHAP